MSYHVKKEACGEAQEMGQLPYNWQADCRGFGDRAVTLVHAGQWTDCSFAVGESGEVIPAHRLILASASPVFAAMLYGPLAETKFPVVIKDVEADVFKEMLYYIITEQANITSISFACELHYTAKKYILTSLMNLCSYCLCQHVDPRSACFLLEYAVLVDELALLTQCIKILKTRTSEVLTANTLEDARLETVKYLFSLEPLNIQSELELYRAAEKYARAQDKKHSLPAHSVIDITDEPQPSTSKAPDVEVISSDGESDTSCVVASDTPADLSVRTRKRRRLVEKAETTGPWIGGPKQESPIRQLLHQVRFLALSPQQFAECATLSFLLSTSEIYGLLMNLCSQHTHVAMPKGFSESRVQRTQVRRSDSSLQVSSAVEADKRRSLAAHVATVPSFSSMESYHSLPFHLLGMPWRVVARPEYVAVNGDYRNKYLSVFVECNWESRTDWSCRADVEIRMLPQYPNYKAYMQKFSATFSKDFPIRGYSTFALWDDVLSRGFVRHDAMTLQVTVYQQTWYKGQGFDSAAVHATTFNPPLARPHYSTML